jgi:hypothetical protein
MLGESVGGTGARVVGMVVGHTVGAGVAGAGVVGDVEGDADVGPADGAAVGGKFRMGDCVGDTEPVGARDGRIWLIVGPPVCVVVGHSV